MNKSEILLKKLMESNIITWIKPNFYEESGEYFDNDYTKAIFYDNGLVFNDIKEFINFMNSGRLFDISKDEIFNNKNDNFTNDNGNEFRNEDDEYINSYILMKEKLINGGIVLPSPIVIKFPNLYYLFAGNRRCNLAWNENIKLTVWLVG
jgi:hypothetical protein